MNANQSGADLPRSVAQKLRAIRRRAITLTLLEGLSLTVAAFLGAMLIAMLTDWLVGWFDPLPRHIMTGFAIGVGVVAFGYWCLPPLFRKRTILSTARAGHATPPPTAEPWSTVTQLSQNPDTP